MVLVREANGSLKQEGSRSEDGVAGHHLQHMTVGDGSAEFQLQDQLQRARSRRQGRGQGVLGCL